MSPWARTWALSMRKSLLKSPPQNIASRAHEFVGVGEVFVEEVEYHVAARGGVARVHGYFAEEVARVGVDYGERTEAVPKVVEHIDGLCPGARALILGAHERASELDGVGQIVVEEALREAEHVAGGYHGLVVGVEHDVASADISVASED